MREIVLDTETTGLDPLRGDRLVEIGCVEILNRMPTGQTFHRHLNPERDMPAEAFAVHGLSSEFLADKPLFAHVVDEVIEFIGGAEIIIHNASFDVGFLNEELRRCNRPKFSTHVAAITDTLAMARDQFPGKSNSLDALCKRLEVDNTNRTLHGALIDANLLAEVYIRLTRGQDSLVMDMTEERGGVAGDLGGPVDLSIFVLPVLVATEAELADHERVLGEIDKASGGKTLWRAQPQEAVA
jgi:DNA polymerase III subunit epsilon